VPKPKNTPQTHRIHVGRTFDVLLERGLDGWIVASVPTMPGCHTQGKTQVQALERIKEAIELCLESGQEPEAGVAVVGLERVTVEA
jgi:predicted RNase H-like HicB family nuclease